MSYIYIYICTCSRKTCTNVQKYTYVIRIRTQTYWVERFTYKHTDNGVGMYCMDIQVSVLCIYMQQKSTYTNILSGKLHVQTYQVKSYTYNHTDHTAVERYAHKHTDNDAGMCCMYIWVSVLYIHAAERYEYKHTEQQAIRTNILHTKIPSGKVYIQTYYIQTYRVENSTYEHTDNDVGMYRMYTQVYGLYVHAERTMMTVSYMYMHRKLYIQTY